MCVHKFYLLKTAENLIKCSRFQASNSFSGLGLVWCISVSDVWPRWRWWGHDRAARTHVNAQTICPAAVQPCRETQQGPVGRCSQTRWHPAGGRKASAPRSREKQYWAGGSRNTPRQKPAHCFFCCGFLVLSVSSGPLPVTEASGRRRCEAVGMLGTLGGVGRWLTFMWRNRRRHKVDRTKHACPGPESNPLQENIHPSLHYQSPMT